MPSGVCCCIASRRNHPAPGPDNASPNDIRSCWRCNPATRLRWQRQWPWNPSTQPATRGGCIWRVGAGAGWEPRKESVRPARWIHQRPLSGSSWLGPWGCWDVDMKRNYVCAAPLHQLKQPWPWAELFSWETLINVGRAKPFCCSSPRSNPNTPPVRRPYDC